MFDPRAAHGFFEDLGLHRLHGGKELTAVIVVLIFDGGGDFRRTVGTGIQHRERGERHAGKPNHAGNHAQRIFRLAEGIAANEFAAEDAFDENKKRQNNQDDENVGSDIAEQQTENPILRQEGADWLIEKTRRCHDDQPFDDVQEFLRHAAFAAAQKTDHKQNDNGQIEPIDGHLVHIWRFCVNTSGSRAILPAARMASPKKPLPCHVSGGPHPNEFEDRRNQLSRWIGNQPIPDGGGLGIFRIVFQNLGVMFPRLVRLL